MLRAIIKFGKKLLLSLIVAAMILVSVPKGDICSYADYSENEIRKVDVVVRAGEWATKDQAKPGKRYDWGHDINISQHGILASEIPTDIPLRCENNNWFISEFDINLKLAKAIAKKLDSKYGVDVNLQYATSKGEDLNAAGRIAAKCDPKVYLSVHHNSFKDDTTGYFFMSNEGDKASSIFAKRLSDAMAANGLIPQRDNRANDGYIGELNTVKHENRISILGEFGYFNKAEIVKICSDKYVDYVSDKISESIYQQLQTLEGKEVVSTEEKKVEEPKVEAPKVEQPKVEQPAEVKVKFGVPEEKVEPIIDIPKTDINLDELNKDLEELNKTMENLNNSVDYVQDKENLSVTISNDVVTIDNQTVGGPVEVTVLSFK